MPTPSKHASVRLLLTLVALLLAANLLVQVGALGTRPVRAAGIPDSGSQFQNMVDELKDVNKRLDTMQRYLESGNLTVKAKVDKDSTK